MTTIYVEKGEIIDYTPTAAVTSNTVVALGALIGVAVADIAAKATGALAVEGVFDLPKGAGAIAVGAPVTFAKGNGNFIAGAGASGDVAGGAVAILPALAGDATVRVKLCPGAGAVA